MTSPTSKLRTHWKVCAAMGKKRIIAETGAGQHGVATATLCARFGLACVVYMGAIDMRAAAAQRDPHGAARRQGRAGAVGHAHAEGCDERGAARLGHQRARHVLLHRHGRRPASLSGDGARLPVGDRRPRRGRRCRRPKAGCRIRSSPASAAAPMPWACSIRSSTIPPSRFSASKPRATGSRNCMRPRSTGGRPGVLHGNRTYLLMNDDGQIQDAHSISAGLDYPGIGPEHSWLHEIGRVKYLSATDDEALEAFQLLLAARRHHPRARARACHRPGDGARAAAAEGSSHRRQPLRPRRQGRAAGRRYPEGEEEVTTRIDRALRATRARKAARRSSPS